jgi:erythromycin esterase
MGYHNFSPKLFFPEWKQYYLWKQFKDYVDVVCNRGPELEKELSKMIKISNWN